MYISKCKQDNGKYKQIQDKVGFIKSNLKRDESWPVRAELWGSWGHIDGAWWEEKPEVQRCQPRSLSCRVLLPISLTRKGGATTAAIWAGNPFAVKIGGSVTEQQKSFLQRKKLAQPSVPPLQRAWLPQSLPLCGESRCAVNMSFIHWKRGLACSGSPDGHDHGAVAFPPLEALPCIHRYSRWDAEAKRWVRWKMNSCWEQLSTIQKGAKPSWWHSQTPLTLVLLPGFFGRASCFAPTLFSCYLNARADLGLCVAACLCWGARTSPIHPPTFLVLRHWAPI